ncbi:hypothetical protein GN956_G14483 [Arapaima gigas]
MRGLVWHLPSPSIKKVNKRLRMVVMEVLRVLNSVLKSSKCIWFYGLVKMKALETDAVKLNIYASRALCTGDFL